MSAFAQNDAVAEFSAGVTATLRRWTALRAAIDGEWGGGDCRSKGEKRKRSTQRGDGNEAVGNEAFDVPLFLTTCLPQPKQSVPTSSQCS